MTFKKDTSKPNKNHGVESKNKRQEEYNKNREGLDLNKESKEKKPFDKKAYRLKKYSKKYKLEQWEEQRTKRLLREYHKDIKNDPAVGTYKAKTFDEDTTDGSQGTGKYVRHPDMLEKENLFEKDDSLASVTTKNKKDPYRKAKEHFNKVKQEKLEKQQEKQKVREQKQQKLEEYKKKKNERFKKLSKKTKKGQPVMTGRLELLLEKIQSSK